MSNNSDDNGFAKSTNTGSVDTSTAFTFLPPESAKSEIKTKTNTKNEIFQFGPARNNSVGNSIDIIVEDVGKLGVSDDDEELFADPPPKEDCPICMLPMPYSPGVCGVDIIYQPCCGKMMCEGCHAAASAEMGKGAMKRWCSFCRKPLPRTDEEYMERCKQRMKLNDGEAFHFLGQSYRDGIYGQPQNIHMALKLLHQAAELGSCMAHYSIGRAYSFSGGANVEKDKKIAYHHYKMAAIGGLELARHNLGCMEEENGNMKRAYKHFMIAAREGTERSLKAVGAGYKRGYVTKDEYASTLRSYQQSRDGMVSEQRTVAWQNRGPGPGYDK